MKLEVEKNDITLIGHTYYEKDSQLVVVCDSKTMGIEQILLRNILKCFGEQYEIVNYYNVDEENLDVVYETNLPYSLYTRTMLED